MKSNMIFGRRRLAIRLRSSMLIARSMRLMSVSVPLGARRLSLAPVRRCAALWEDLSGA
jgi:hypothetical protein